MKDIKYYVLGKKDNSMLKKNLDGYYDILVNKIDNIKESDLREKLRELKSDKKFILTTDNSSRIEYLYLVSTGESELYGHRHIVESFLEDIEYYKENKKLNTDNSTKIKNTNIYLSIFDRNPYNGLETHPDHFKEDVGVGYGNQKSEKWIDIYSKAFEALKSVDEGIYDELNFIIQKIVAIGTDDFVHNSASYKEAIGHLYMGLTNSEDELSIVQCLEAVIHESSHNKLNLVNKFDRLLLNNFDLKYYSPYRPDARHVWGIFLGIHAFVPTIYTLLRYYKQNNMSDNHLLEKLLTYNIKNNLSLKVLSRHAKFTDIGNEIMQEVKYVMLLTNNILKELQIDEKLLKFSKEKALKHFNEVKTNYPYLRY